MRSGFSGGLSPFKNPSAGKTSIAVFRPWVGKVSLAYMFDAYSRAEEAEFFIRKVRITLVTEESVFLALRLLRFFIYVHLGI